jgi:hypothetical protein
MDEKTRDAMLGLALTIGAFLAMAIAIQIGIEG